MIQGTIPISLNGRQCLPGYRLKRLELLNWGTFCDTVHRIVPDARWSLIVGDNGSGKSTAADALRTLLVPPAKLSYNDASTDQKLKHSGGKDRTKATYIRGAYRATSQEDSAIPVLHYHREERTLAIILAVFTNEVQQSDVTLAQLHWVENNKPDQIYLVARSGKTIKEHLTGLTPGRDIKKELKRRGFEPEDSFPAYEEKFRRLLGIPGTNALEVFNQVIGVKEVKDLNQFVRKHMLEPSDAREFIETHIRPNYLQLNACWEAIKKAEAQLLILNQVAEHYGKLEIAKNAYSVLASLKEALPHYYNQRALDLRLRYDEELEERITQLAGEETLLIADQERHQHRKESISIALGKDKEGQRLKDIEREIDLATTERDRRNAALMKIRAELTALQQSFALDTEQQFSAMRHKLLTHKGPLQGNYETQERKKMEHYVGKDSAEKNRENLAREAQSVRDSGALIPRKFLEARKQICLHTGVAEKDLPFAGELIEVASDYKEWTGAIERLLRGLGTSLLVGERHYRPVAEYINSNHLGLRLVFHQVPSMYTPARVEFLQDRKRIPGRLCFMEESPFANWLKAEVTRQFSHPCCDTVSELREISYGITKEGLIKDGSRHVKDDNFRLNDRTNYVLGWSTQSKLAALMEQYQEADRLVSENDKRFKHAVEQLRALSCKLEAIRSILAIDDFEQIDTASKKLAIDKLVKEKESIEKASDKLSELKKQLKEVENLLKDATSKTKEVGERIGSEKGRRQDNQTVVHRLRDSLMNVTSDFESVASQVLKIQGNKTLTLESLDEIRTAVAQYVDARMDAQISAQQTATELMMPAMERFMNSYPHERATLKASAEYGPDFVRLRDEIKGEELPKHQERFFSLLNQKLILDMAALQTKVFEHEKDIRQRINLVNATLKHTRFSSETYVHIRITPTTSREIGDFKSELKECLARGIMPGSEDLERIYTRIRELIGRFDKEPDWTVRVTDARNWMDYGVQARFLKDDTEAQYFAGSSGKSGGEKTILAFNILASAITSQYGLTGNGEDLNRFRLVVVDEAFSKTDPDNSRRTMELFKALGLQLLVINPWDAKSRIVEDFVDTFHLASTDPETDRSSLTRATRERYLEVQRAKDLERKAA